MSTNQVVYVVQVVFRLSQPRHSRLSRHVFGRIICEHEPRQQQISYLPKTEHTHDEVSLPDTGQSRDPKKATLPSSRPDLDAPSLSPDAIARNILTPSLLAANTIAAVLPTDAPWDIPALIAALGEQSRKVIDGDLSRAEAMLMTQAHTLNALFTALTRRAVAQEYLNQYETYMRLGLKAQSQCRATLETLATIKNPPPVTFVRQANVAHGPQQVNNGTPPPAGQGSRAGNSENRPNELLEQQHGERLDSGAAQAAVGADSTMATMGEVHRPPDSGW